MSDNSSQHGDQGSDATLWQQHPPTANGASPAPQMPQAYPSQAHLDPMSVRQQPLQQHQLAVGNPSSLGKVRSNPACIGLFIITLGIYGFFWTYNVYSEMKRHRGAGTGGGVAVLLMFVPLATYFMTPGEISNLYASRGRRSPVSGATGLWCFLPFLGPLVWFLQVNGALNDYWKSMGAGSQKGQPQISA